MVGIKSLLVACGFSILAFSCTKVIDSGEMGGEFDFAGIVGVGTGGGQVGDSTLQAGKITAGEWNDLNNWAFWQGILGKPDFAKFPGYWGYNTQSRLSLLIKNEQGFILVDEPVSLLDVNGTLIAEARSDNKGVAEFFPYLNGIFKGSSTNNLFVKINNSSFTNLKTIDKGINELIINKNKRVSTILDIAFVVDATSSMGDEISYLKIELDDVIRRIRSNYNQLTVNTAAVFYRDEGDSYVTRSQPFSNNFQPVLSFINDQQADGGGDFPEAVHRGLNASINDLAWSSTARARILFLLLDAPPHYEPGIVDEIHNYISIAAKKGIKIIPVTASGIDKETEFLMRYFSISTNGTYVFITNHSGIGNDHIEPSVGQYEVEYLNDLMVRLIGKYLE